MVGTAYVEAVGTSPTVVLNAQIEFPLSVPVCAWCKPGLKRGLESRALTHGICPRHLRVMRLKMQNAPAPARRHVNPSAAAGADSQHRHELTRQESGVEHELRAGDEPRLR